VEQILAKQTTDLMPNLSEERPDIPEGIADVLSRAMRNDVEARYGSAGEFRSALEEAVLKGARRRGSELARLAARILGT
jgi:hypothetical protein